MLPVHCSRATLTSLQEGYLFQLYRKLYCVTDDSDLYLSSICLRYSHVTVNGKQLGSKKSRSASSSTVMAMWNVNWFGPCSDADIVTRAASINYFSKHTVSLKRVNKTRLQIYPGFCIIQRIVS